MSVDKVRTPGDGDSRYNEKMSAGTELNTPGGGLGKKKAATVKKGRIVKK